VATKGTAGAKAPKRGPPPGGPNLKAFYALLVLVALVGVGWIGWSVANRGNAAATEPIVLTGMENVQTLLDQAQGVKAGNADAAAQVIVFSDFTCPACAQFTRYIEPQLRTEFIDRGLIGFTYFDYPLGGESTHRWGFLASRAARCARDQGKFWEYHDLLFGRQAEWSYDLRRPPVDRFVEYARLLALDARAFESCVASDTYQDVVTANRLLGDQLGVHATPTLFVAGRSIETWNSWEAVRAAILSSVGSTTIPADTAGAGT
jgi:protein-disulfide isomerase